MKPVARKILLAVVLLPMAFSAWGQEANTDRQELEALRQTTMKLIELMVQSGIITQEKADELLREARRNAAQATAPAKEGDTKPKVVRVPYVPQSVRDDIKEEIRQEVVVQAKQERWGEPGALPEWLGRIKFYGDVRLRYQYNQLASGNAPYLNVQDTNAGNGLVLLNTTENSDLWRIRARLGVDAKVTDWVTAGLRFSTGSNNNPVSDNQTLGSTFNRINFGLDRAYIKLDPYSWLTFSGGRFANPFFYSDLVWDDDLNFEGIALTARPGIATDTVGFLTLGAFPIENIDCTNATQVANCGGNKWLYGAQAGIERRLQGDSRFKVGIAIYDFQNIAGNFNDPVVDPSNRTGIPKFMQKGNSVFDIVTSNGNPLLGLAADFRELDLTASLDLAQGDPIHVVLLGDVVKNIGYDRQKVLARTGGLVDQEPRTLGYQARLTVGHTDMARASNWQAFGGYKYLQRDAVVDGFTDSDFHLGGTDAKGWMIGASYAIAKKTWLRARWLTANEIDGPPLAIDVLQVDLNAEF